jgi:hypothetical protein
VRRVAFDALPLAAREAFVATVARRGGAEPLLEDRAAFGPAIARSAALAAVALLVTYLFLAADVSESRLPWSAAEVAGALLAVAAGALLTIAHRARLRRLPYAPGRYVTARDFVDARGPELRLRALSTLADARVVHDHQGKAYVGSRVTLSFEDGAKEAFDVPSKELATLVAEELRAARGAVDDGEVDDDDPDPFSSARGPLPSAAPRDVEGPRAGPVGVLDRPIGRWIAAAAIGAALALPAVALRNRFADDAMFAHAKAVGTEAAMRAYLEVGKRHVAEANDELPRAALADAKRAGTVTALRNFLAMHRGSPVEAEGRAALHEAYARALASFTAQASGEEPRLGPFMARLLGWLEDHELTRVEVRFSSPSSAMLGLVDEALSDPKLSREGTVAKVAPHFDDAHSRPREAAITKQLATGFASVFPPDVLRLEPGARAEAGVVKAEPAPILVPTIDVSYTVGWSGDVYGEENGDRKFVSIVMNFDVEMRIPGPAPGAAPLPADTLGFTLSVAPPESFDVHYKDDASGPTEGRIYDAMAERAFDQLGDKLRAAFFGKGARPRPVDAMTGEPAAP